MNWAVVFAAVGGAVAGASTLIALAACKIGGMADDAAQESWAAELRREAKATERASWYYDDEDGSMP